MVYISGNITDNPDFEKDFFKAHKQLYKAGHGVVNPVDLAYELEQKIKGTTENFPSLSEKSYFRNSIQELLKPHITGIYFLEKSDSIGCQAERLIAKKLQIQEITL